MGDSQKLSVQLTLDATGLVQGLAVSTRGVDTAAQAIRRSFKDAGEGSEGFTDILKDFKKEATQASRVAKFYANDLAEIIPGATGAAGAIKGLIAAGLSGGGFATGFEIAVVAIKAVNEALMEQKKLATETAVAHIEAASRIEEVYRRLEDSLSGTKTKSMTAASESAKAIRTAGEEAAKANVAVVHGAGGGWDAIANGINAATAMLGRFGVLSGMEADQANEISSLVKTSFEKVTESYIKADAVVQAVDARKKIAAESLDKENRQLAEENADRIRELEVSTSDFVVRTRAARDAKLNALKRASPEAGTGVGAAYAREQAMETAVRKTAEVQIAHFREDKALETRARIRVLETEHRTEQEQLQAAMLTRLEKLRLDLSRTTDARLRADIQAVADFELKTTRAKIARLDALQAAEIAASDHNSGRGEYGKKTEEATKLVELYYQTETQHDALAEAHNDKRVADELISVREGAAKQIADITALETAGLLTHEVFAQRKKDIEKTLADETGAIWAKAGSHWANDFVRPLESGFSSAVKSVVHQTASIEKAIESLGLSIVDSLIDGAIKVGLKSLEEAVLAHAATSVKNVAGVVSYAAVAGAAAASAAAATPIVGPFIAIPTGLAMEAAVMSAFAPQAAAAQGFDIPPGINPITQLHQKEMVLPQNIADPLRDMLASGSQGGGPPIIIQALDSQSFEEYMGRPSTQQKIANLRRTGRWGG